VPRTPRDPESPLTAYLLVKISIDQADLLATEDPLAQLRSRVGRLRKLLHEGDLTGTRVRDLPLYPDGSNARFVDEAPSTVRLWYTFLAAIFRRVQTGGD